MARVELDYMEYATDAAAQSAYATNAVATKLFGKDDAGDTTGGAGYAVYNQYTASAGTVTHIALYSASASNVKVALYSDSAGEPNTRLATATASVGSGFALIPITPVEVSNGTNYWITCIYETNNALYVTVGGAPRRYKSEEYAGFNYPATYDGTGYTADTVTHSQAAYLTALQDFSESTIKTQGSYSLKGIATTDAVNKTLTKTVSPTIDLSGKAQIKFDIYALRTGSNIKVGIHDSGGTTTETTPNVADSNTWQTVTWDISGVSDANKDAIDQIIITIVNADSANTFYIDNMYAQDVFGGFTLLITDE